MVALATLLLLDLLLLASCGRSPRDIQANQEVRERDIGFMVAEARSVAADYQPPSVAGKTTERTAEGEEKHYFSVSGEVRNRGDAPLFLESLTLSSNSITAELAGMVRTTRYSPAGSSEKTSIEYKELAPGGAWPFELRLDSRTPDNLVIDGRLVLQDGSSRSLGPFRLSVTKTRSGSP